jgi:hypothetical protein
MYMAGCLNIRVRVKICSRLFDQFVSKADGLGKRVTDIRVRWRRCAILPKWAPCQDRIALQLKPLQCEPDKVNLGNISNYVDFAEIKNSPYLRVLHKLLFETSATSLQSGYPAVYLTKPLKLQKDVMVKLTKHWVSHGAGYNPCIYAAKPVLDELLQLSHHQFRHTALDDSTTTQLCHNISSNGRINWIKIIDHPWAGQGFVV